MPGPLEGVRVLSIAINLPGPAAVAPSPVTSR